MTKIKRGEDRSSRSNRQPRTIALTLPEQLLVRQVTTSENQKEYEEQKQNREAQLAVGQEQLGASQAQVDTGRKLNLITVVAAAISALGLFAVGYGLKLSKDATDAAIAQTNLNSKQFMLSERPWVSSSPEIDGPFFFDKDGAHLQLKFHLHNSGLSPASNVFTYVRFFPLSTNLQEAETQRRETCNATETFLQDSDEVIIPGADSVQKRRFNFTQEEIKQYGKPGGYLPIQVVSCVAYKSALNETYSTAQIYSLEGVNTPNQPPGVFGGMNAGVNVPAFQLRIEPKFSDVYLEH